jgi:hypothetical protein
MWETGSNTLLWDSHIKAQKTLNTLKKGMLYLKRMAMVGGGTKVDTIIMSRRKEDEKENYKPTSIGPDI